MSSQQVTKSPKTAEHGSRCAFHLTRIVATLGPASSSDDAIRELIHNGVDVFRLNFSHGTHDEHAANVERIRRIATEMDTCTAILQDIPGPKLRLGDFAGDAVTLEAGNDFKLIAGLGKPGDATHAGFESEGWHKSVQPGERVLLGDGAIELEVTRIDGDTIHTVVRNGGEVRSRQGLNFPESDLDLAAVTDSDWDHIAFGLGLEVDAVALSFVQGPDDLIAVRRFMQRKGDHAPLLIAKIETPRAVENIREILQRCDGIMVARGDLGIALPIEQIPIVQKELIHLARESRTFVITATQMLESMIHAPRPTRAEATDVANAVYDGTDSVMLSGETAIGDHPALVVDTMCRILETTEPRVTLPGMKRLDGSVDAAVARTVKDLARELEAKAVLAPISSGSTAMRMSRQRMGVPILVGTTRDRLARRLIFFQGVFPFVVDPDTGLKKATETLIERAVAGEFIQQGDRVILTGGLPVEKAGTTNFLRALTVGDEI